MQIATGIGVIAIASPLLYNNLGNLNAERVLRIRGRLYHADAEKPPTPIQRSHHAEAKDRRSHHAYAEMRRCGDAEMLTR